jgi:putative radical SAM enzyme (TIGR03279 family)
MRYLADCGIELHAQIVLCPEINDGEVLLRTINDLAGLHPMLTSVAIVPVVFSKLHNYAHLLTPVTGDYARDLIKVMRPLQRDFTRRLGSTFVFLADEFYLRAGLQVPPRAHYGDYPQIEDGVGMVRRFILEAKRTLRRDLATEFGLEPGSLRGTVATGELFYPTLSGFVMQLNEKYGTSLNPIALKNQFFGEEMTVAGLMAGGDLLKARDRIKGDFVIVPEQACLKSGHIFLDDLTIEDLQENLGLPVAHGGPSFKSLIEQASKLLCNEGV